jgi:hypothetical protein
MQFVPFLRFRTLSVLVLGAALTLACDDAAPTAPDPVPSFAVAKGPLSIDSRSLRFQCNAGLPCTAAMIVTASSPVTVSYQIDGGDFIINPASTTCVQGGTLTGSCNLSVKVATTEIPGRRSATLVISESTSGTSVTVRLSARVS